MLDLLEHMESCSSFSPFFLKMRDEVTDFPRVHFLPFFLNTPHFLPDILHSSMETEEYTTEPMKSDMGRNGGGVVMHSVAVSSILPPDSTPCALKQLVHRYFL